MQVKGQEIQEKAALSANVKDNRKRGPENITGKVAVKR